MPAPVAPLPVASRAPSPRAAARTSTGAGVLWFAAGAAGQLGACTTPPPPVVGITDLAERPAERALIGAMRAYDDADYPAVERQVDDAMSLGLRSPRDLATAHKLRAFVYCTSDRMAACEDEFRAARMADPAFALSHAEAGHPLWGPIYVRSRQQPAAVARKNTGTPPAAGLAPAPTPAPVDTGVPVLVPPAPPPPALMPPLTVPAASAPSGE